MSNATMPWVDGRTIGDVLRETSQRHADCDAIVFPQLKLRLSYRELEREVDRVSRALLGLGIEKGDHVAVWATNHPQWVLLQLGTARIGAVLVTVNPAYLSAELAYVLRQSDAKALFLLDRFRQSDYFGLAASAIAGLSDSPPGLLKPSQFPKLRHVVSITDSATGGILPWNAFLQLESGVSAEDCAARAELPQADDPINIQYTSGTTGFPKGAMLTHRNLLLNAYYVGECQHFSPQDRICIPVPFYHCFGCVLGVLCAVAHGAAMIIPAEYFDAAATLSAIEAESATAIYGVPTMFIAELEHASFAERNLSTLRTGIMAGSPCPIEIMKRVVHDMGAAEITIAYGQTEASPVITQTRTDDPLQLRVSTVGRPIPGIEVKIIDPATGATLPDNQPGELCTRGHVVMKGYYNMPEETHAAIDTEGWLHTGDLALRQSDGYYRITGRIKEMICRGGENVYPREIEEALYGHPEIEDVAVVGVPDAKFVEEIAAWVKLKSNSSLTAEHVREFCKAHLARYKCPRYVKVVTEFPQTVTGKVQKFKIREAMIEELGLDEPETA